MAVFNARLTSLEADGESSCSSHARSTPHLEPSTYSLWQAVTPRLRCPASVLHSTQAMCYNRQNQATTFAYAVPESLTTTMNHSTTVLTCITSMLHVHSLMA